MKISKRQLRSLILEAVSDEISRKRYEEFKKSRELPKFDDQFLQSFKDDEGNLDPSELEYADDHYDDAIARSKGYKDAINMEVAEWSEEIEADEKKLKKMRSDARATAGIKDDNFNPDHYSKFNMHKQNAIKALEKGDESYFESQYQMMRRFGRMIDYTNPDGYESEPGVKELIQAREEIRAGGLANFFNIKRSPTLKSLGIFEE